MKSALKFFGFCCFYIQKMSCLDLFGIYVENQNHLHAVNIFSVTD